MKQLQFRMAAYTDAAGKYNPDAERSGNEDSFYVDDNLGDEIPSHCVADEVTTLSECGMLMAIADGMGGMNAGEVASEIAIETVKDYFAPGQITPQLANTHESRRKYLEKVIVEADRRIKSDAKQNPEREGMGSTIILAWLAGNELTVSWCGDSRAYRFNPQSGIELLSEDHSYVQDLVREGKLKYKYTFDHPQNNIVTRSLGDPFKKAQPETRYFEVYKSDIIFLCSDGLSGVLRDKKEKDDNGNWFPGETLEDIIRENHSSMITCREALWNAAERANWYDNVTLILCEILDGVPDREKAMIPDVPQERDVIPPINEESSLQTSFWNKTLIHISINVKRIICLCIFLAVLLWGSWYKWKNHGFKVNQYISHIDSLETDNESLRKDTILLKGQIDSLKQIIDSQLSSRDSSPSTERKTTENTNSGSISELTTSQKDHVVKKDETLEDIVKRYADKGVTLEQIKKDNKDKIGEDGSLHEGDTIRVNFKKG